MKRRYPSDRLCEAWRATIDENGSKNIQMRQLLRAFGYQRRSEAGIREVRAWLEERGIFTYGLEGPTEGDLNGSVVLAAHAMTRLGRLVEYEEMLKKQYLDDIMAQLQLQDPISEYKPKGTRDRFDYLCRDAEKNAVVVEIKRADGEKRGVEQVMRYIGLLRSEGERSPRGVLITGYADPHTRRALEGRDSDRHIDWWVYGLEGDRLLMERIDIGPPRRR